MQPNPSDQPTSSSSLRRWLPLGAAAVAVLVVAALVVSGGGGDDAETETTTTSAAPATTAPAGTSDTTQAPAADEPAGDDLVFPLTFEQAGEQGLEVAWDERCDTERGVLAVPDFFAPACYVPFGDRDNGGATDQGVTADSITVVYYLGLENDPIIDYITDALAVDESNEAVFDTLSVLDEYYATFYETYGRRVNLIRFDGTGLANDAVAARADAVRIAEEYEPFMVLGGPALTNAFADELAARGVACISCTPSQPGDWYAQRDPLVWSVDASASQKDAHLVDFVAQYLVGGTAEFASGDLTSQPRRFGLLYLDGDGVPERVEELTASLAAQGVELAESIPYELNPATLQQTAAQVVARMKAAGVTTVLFNGDPVAPRDFTREATAQDWFPEWVLGAVALADTTAFSRTYDQQQWRGAFGITTLAARLLPEQSGSYRLHTWFAGEPPAAPDSVGVVAPPLSVFYAIVQGTGPNLTHETWRDALMVGAGTRRAISQPSLSWGDHGYWPDTDYHGIDDVAVIWWDTEATGSDEIRREGQGMWRYHDGGTRYMPGDLVRSGALFDAATGVTLYEEAPPGEAPPDYPAPQR